MSFGQKHIQEILVKFGEEGCKLTRLTNKLNAKLSVEPPISEKEVNDYLLDATNDQPPWVQYVNSKWRLVACAEEKGAIHEETVSETEASVTSTSEVLQNLEDALTLARCDLDKEKAEKAVLLGNIENLEEALSAAQKRNDDLNEEIILATQNSEKARRDCCDLQEENARLLAAAKVVDPKPTKAADDVFADHRPRETWPEWAHRWARILFGTVVIGLVMGLAILTVDRYLPMLMNRQGEVADSASSQSRESIADLSRRRSTITQEEIDYDSRIRKIRELTERNNRLAQKKVR